MTLTTSSPIHLLKGVGEVYAEKLKSSGIHTVKDLLLHFPVDYLECGKETRELCLHGPALYSGRILSLSLSRNFRRRLSTVRILLETGAGKIQALVFNQPYLSRQLSKGQKLWLYGRVDAGGATPVLVSPRLFLSAPEGIIPVYRELAGISRGRMKTLIQRALEAVEPDRDPLPQWIREQRALPPWDEAIHRIHRPEAGRRQDLPDVLNRFRYSEFLDFHLELRLVREQLKNIPRRFQYSVSAEFSPRVEGRLGFPLTQDQKNAVNDVLRDLQGATAMQRLIQGDVGTGKTAVAFSAMLLAVLNGYQVAFLAPTELLARQHEEKARRFFAEFAVATVTGSTLREERRQIEADIRSGRLQVIFGTHALLNGRLAFKRLAMIVIDEQQRFGVSQRASLYCKGQGADLLVTTATPIPRTLLLVLYKDLSVSTIRSRPHGQRRVKTRILDLSRRQEFYDWLALYLESSRENPSAKERVFVILPRIRQPESGARVSSLEIEGEFLKRRFAGLGAAILSSETPAVQRQRILEKFRKGEIQVLIATTVIELGIHVADANFMVIENADRFGLAQLHQLRGRIGRSGGRGHCYLIRSEDTTEKGKRRLECIASEADGFRLAEKDLEMRGGGEVAGTRQAGSLDFRFGDPIRDHRVFLQAGEDAIRVLEGRDSRTPHLEAVIQGVVRRIRTLHFS